MTRLPEALGFTLADEALARQALTHPSYAHEHAGTPHYQRLELLGDAVVDLCVTHLLFARFPDATEGQLTDLRQRLVNTRELGRVGALLGVPALVRVGAGEAQKPAVEPSIVGDVVEALLGALYLEAGLEPCRAAVTRWLGPRIEALRSEHAADAVKSPVNRLQEFTQARWKATPVYEHHSHGPDHDRTFTARVRVRDEVLGEGCATSKKEAMVAAARLALSILERREAPP